MHCKFMHCIIPYSIWTSELGGESDRFGKKGSVVQLETHSSSARHRRRSVGQSQWSVTHVSYISRFASSHDSSTLTPCSRILLEKLTCSHLVKKFPHFYGTWRFLSAYTRARHLSLFWPSPTHVCNIRCNISLSLTSGLFPSGLPTITL
jgi:hypothetical protein